MDFSVEPLTEELANGDNTFDRLNENQRTLVVEVDAQLEFDPYTRIVNHRPIMNSVPTHDSLGTGWCRKCSTSAKMSGSDPEQWERSGVCDTRGCPGYRGHPPAGRPQGADHDDTSDDVPLLFSPLSSSSASHSSQELELVDHCHGLEPKRDASAQARRKLGFATLLCSVFVTGEIVGGYYSGSLAIMGDAAHMFSDLASFGVSFMVLWISDKKPVKKMTFGFHRAEALGALATLCIIWYVTGILVFLAVKRIHDQDFEIHDTAMLAVASAAVVFNLLLGYTLHGVCNLPHAHSHGGHAHDGDHGHSHGADNSSQINIRAALIHVLGDLLQSIGVLLSSLLIKFFGDSCKIADPICTLIFACIVGITTMGVLKDTLRILLEGTPPSIDYDSVLQDLLSIKEVCKVHSLHIWSLTADLPVMSAHLATPSNSADQEQIRALANRILRSKYKIFRTTLQVEHYDPQVMGNCEKCNTLV